MCVKNNGINRINSAWHVNTVTEHTNERMSVMENKENNGKNKAPGAMKKFKIAYAFALVLVVGGALIAKTATEKSLGNLKGSLEDELTVKISTTSKDTKHLYDDGEDVRQNVTGIPDTRATETPTEKAETTTEKSKYAVPYEDYYTLPCGTKIIKDYSPDKPVYSATMGDWRAHTGIDFGAAEGEAVKSISNGTVLSVYDDALLGTTITVDHGNGVTAKYCGFDKDSVQIKKGSALEAGTTLGFLGTIPSEKSDGCHLHFEILYKENSVEPMELMGK